FAASDLLPNVQRIATLLPTDIGPTNATLNGRLHTTALLTQHWFEWGTTTNYGNTTSVSTAGAANGTVIFGHFLTGLSLDTTHHYRAVASNALGIAYGTNQTFKT